MSRTLASALSLVLVAAMAMPVEAAPPEYGLASPRACLAGNFGEPQAPEWRVQLGVFHDAKKADALVERLNGRGLSAEPYIALWLDADQEPLVVVSAPYRSRAAAERAARRYRRHGMDTLVRSFVPWSR